MASNKNIPQKSQGANEPDKKQSVQSDAADVDWMIMSDISTRIGGSPEIKSSSNQSLAGSASQISSNQDADHDLDDLEFLRSIGLDEEIESPPSSRNTANTSGSYSSQATDNDEVNNIDWLIVTDLSTRKKNNEVDNTEGKIQGLAELLDDNDDSSFDLIAGDENDDWDSISGIFENDFNQLSNEPNLDIAVGLSEMPSQVSEVFGTPENVARNIDIDLGSNLFSEDNDSGSLLVDNLELSDESQSDQIVKDFEISSNNFQSEFQDEFQDELQNSQDQDLSFNEFEVGNLEVEFDNESDDEFGAVQSLESFESSVTEDNFWSNTSPNLEAESMLDDSVENAFTNDWGEPAANAIDDAIWDANPSIATDLVSSISIDNAFDTSDDDDKLEAEIGHSENWSAGLEVNADGTDVIGCGTNLDSLIEDEIIVTNPSEEEDWSASLEAEISNGNNVIWDEAAVETGDYLPPIEEYSEVFNDDFLGLVGSGTTEQPLNEDFDSESEAIDLQISGIYDGFNDVSGNLDVPEQIVDQQQFTDFNEFIDPSYDDIDASLEIGEFDFSENSLPPSSDWENLSESITEQVTDSDFANFADNFAAEQFSNSGLGDNFASYSDSFDNDIVPLVNANLGDLNWDASTAGSSVAESGVAESGVIGSNDADNIGDMLDENFDLASFDEDGLLEVPAPDSNFGSILTTLTPNRANAFSEDSAGYTNQQSSINPIDIFVDNAVSQSDPFEEALANNLLDDSYEEVNFEEEALAHDLLNGLVIDPIGEDRLDDGFVSAPMSTGLTASSPPSPPMPPIPPMPPSLPPLTKQEPTSPSINNLPPPPPFLPPLPPKRNPTHGSTTPAPAYPTVNANAQPMPQNRMGRRTEDDDFDRFHAQPDQHKNRSKPISSIDEAWSDLLDADTVLSGGIASTGSSYSGISSTTPPSAERPTGRASQSRERRDRNSISRRTETGLPDLNDLGLEVHDDNTDWSGLLDSSDLSDSITTISPQSTKLPSRIRTNPVVNSRTDMTGTSETREIPRDRRNPMASFGDSTQARTSSPRDQIDFNRFTEDNYDEYGDYEQAAPPSEKTPNKPKLTIPSISLESLWQNYLKIPAIGLGAIGGGFLLYSLLNRPVFDLGLRWGLLKDASGKDFTKADFRKAKLDGVDFSKAILTEAKMQEASLVGANFQGANLDGVNFTKANLSRARLIQSSVIWSEFNNAQMNLVDLAGADLTRSNFAGAKMEGANLKDSKIGAQGTEKATRFSPTTLLAWQIVNEPREGRNLADQDLSGLNLSFTSLKRANLTNVKLNYTDMTNTDLSGANLSSAQINGANWSGAKLNGINLTGIVFDKNKLPKTDEETICPNGKKGPCKF